MWYTNYRMEKREKMTKVRIEKDTWAHSKKCWYIVDAKKGLKYNYFGHTSKKNAIANALECGAEVIS